MIDVQSIPPILYSSPLTKTDSWTSMDFKNTLRLRLCRESKKGQQLFSVRQFKQIGGGEGIDEILQPSTDLHTALNFIVQEETRLHAAGWENDRQALPKPYDGVLTELIEQELGVVSFIRPAERIVSSHLSPKDESHSHASVPVPDTAQAEGLVSGFFLAKEECLFLSTRSQEEKLGSSIYKKSSARSSLYGRLLLCRKRNASGKIIRDAGGTELYAVEYATYSTPDMVSPITSRQMHPDQSLCDALLFIERKIPELKGGGWEEFEHRDDLDFLRLVVFGAEATAKVPLTAGEACRNSCQLIVSNEPHP